MKKPLISILLLTLFACNEGATLSGAEGEEIIPAHVLSKKDMVSVMVDVQLIEAALSAEQSDEAKEAAAGDYDFVLKQHNISREKFDESFKYYAEHPTLMEQIYEEMLTMLSKKQAEVENEK